VLEMLGENRSGAAPGQRLRILPGVCTLETLPPPPHRPPARSLLTIPAPRFYDPGAGEGSEGRKSKRILSGNG
jgi:hypothetical protein